MNKSKMLYGMGMLFTFLCLTLNSCKKDTAQKLTDAEKIQLAKEWYQKSLTNQTALIKNSQNQATNLVFTPNWDKAKVEYIEDSFGIILPVETNIQNITGKSTTFSLVISKVNDTYESKTVSVKNLNGSSVKDLISTKDIYLASFTDASLSLNSNIELKVFGKKFKVEKELSFDKDGKKLSTQQTPLPASLIEKNMSLAGKIPNTTAGGCIFWFLITTNYDGYGNVTSVSSVLIDYTCDAETIDWIQPGEGGFMVDFGSPQSVSKGEQWVDTSDSTKTMYATWSLHSAGTYSLESREIGGILKRNATWAWNDFHHRDHYVEGMVPGGDISITSFVPVMYYQVRVAVIDVDYQTKITAGLMGGSTFHSGPLHSGHKYDIPSNLP